MRTLIYRIDERAGDRYRVALHCCEAADEDADWLDQPVAEAAWPAPLTTPEGEPIGVETGYRLLAESADQYRALLSFGHTLLSVLRQGKVGAAWRERWEAGSDAEPVRTVLDIADPDLRRLPWELVAAGDTPLVTEHARPWVRGSLETWKASLQLGEDPLQLTPPVRVLVVVAARGGADDGVDQEVHNLCGEFPGFGGWLEEVILRQPDKQTIKQAVECWYPHVFHFVGHGRADANGLALQLWDSEQENYTDAYVADVLNWFANWRPHLVFLNACRSGAHPGELEHLSSGFGDLRAQLLAKGVGAVLAMQGDIVGSLAARLAKTAFRALRAGESLDVALARARSDVMLATNAGRRDVYLPVIDTAAPPDRVLPTLRRDQIDDHSEISKELRPFVNRAKERRRLMQLEPFALPGNGPSPNCPGLPAERRYVAAVQGGRRKGKTALVKRAARMFASRGWTVRYVQFPVGERGSYTKVLHGVASDQGAGFWLPAPIADLPTPGEQAEMDEDELAAAATALLEATAKEAPTLIILDDIQNLYRDDFEKLLRPHLIDPIARGEWPDHRVVLSGSDIEDMVAEIPELLDVPIVDLDEAEFKWLLVQSIIQELGTDHEKLPEVLNHLEQTAVRGRNVERLTKMRKGLYLFEDVSVP